MELKEMKEDLIVFNQRLKALEHTIMKQQEKINHLWSERK